MAAPKIMIVDDPVVCELVGMLVEQAGMEQGAGPQAALLEEVATLRRSARVARRFAEVARLYGNEDAANHSEDVAARVSAAADRLAERAVADVDCGTSG